MSIKKDTIIRTIILIVALINQILTSTGHSVIPITDEQITEIISLIFTIAASLWAWWKNNSFTSNALQADEFLQELKISDKEAKYYG
jgi:SPP1 family holin